MSTRVLTGLLAVVACAWALTVEGHAEPTNDSEGAPGGNGTALALRAMRLQNAGMYRSAAAEWKAFLQRYPENKYRHLATFHLGKCFSALELHELVVDTLANYAMSFPTSSNVPAALRVLAISRERLAAKGKGTFLEAAASFRELFEAAPEGQFAPFALYSESKCLYNADKFEQARAPVERLLRNRKSASDEVVRNASLLRGLIVLRLDEQDAARTAFEEVITTWPQSESAANAHYFLGDVLSVEGKHAEAADQFRIASESKGCERADIAAFRYAQALENAGDPESAGQAYRSLRQRFPNSKTASYADQRLKHLAELAGNSEDKPSRSN